jgi:hypothetical protein
MSRNQSVGWCPIAVSGFSLLLALAVVPHSFAQETSNGDRRDAPAAARNVAVWDTGREYVEDGSFAALRGRSEWRAAPADARGEFRFRGDCIVENEHLWLYLPARKKGVACLWAKNDAGKPLGVILHQYGQDQAFQGPNSSTILQMGDEEVVVQYERRSADGRTMKVAYRVASGRHWVEASAVEHAARIGIGVKSQFVIAPSEFGEDFICDSTKQKPTARIPLPKDHLIIALNCDGDLMSVITYPSVDQAGDVVVGAKREISNHGHAVSPAIIAVNARFLNESVFIGLLPHQHNWHFERIKKIYSAAGQYASQWTPPYPGVWRLAGRVRGKYRVNDAAGGHLTFACSWGGIFDHLFAYLYLRTEDTPENVVTPMDIYRETLGAGPDAYLLDSEIANQDRAGAGRTKHRDVCGTVNDLKETWNDHLDRVKTEPNYITNLTNDAKTIMARMESRLNGYRRLSDAVAGLAAKMDETKTGAGLAEFANGVQKCCEQFKNVKPTRFEEGCRTADQIAQFSQEHTDRLKADRKRLDVLAEQVRSVASGQENRLKEYRKITVDLSSLCQQRRATEQKELSRYVTAIGRHCRRLLRNRDPEE